ncbi:MAG: hypothetical protein V4695_06520 [Pseudomonadota bacterium]
MVRNSTTNEITTVFTPASADAALRLKAVYTAVGTFSQNNSGHIVSNGGHDAVVTRGNAQIDVTAIGNNFAADLVGIPSAHLAVTQKNSGNIAAINTVTRPEIGGNLEVTTTAIGNNASIGWDLTTDKNPSNNTFAVKKDGEIRGFENVGSLVSSLAQCNTGNVIAFTDYRKDPAANIKVSTTAIGNNMSFGVKTR